MAKKQLFRSDIARGIEKGAQGVDRDVKHEKGKGIVFGYAVIAKGTLNEGDSRNWEMDDTSLEQIVQMGSASKAGLKSRFGHPNMSSESLGTFLGRAKNFRKDGDIVRADLYFDETAYKTPNGDLASYVMDLAESDPAAFGSSLVFDMDLEIRLDQGGAPKKDENGKELPALVRFKKLFASDMVDDPAATPGVFGTFFNSSVELSDKATGFLDKLLNSPDALEKVISFLERYRVNSEGIDHPIPLKDGPNQVDIDLDKNKPGEEGDKEMDELLKDLTVEQLGKARPELVSSLQNEAVKGERSRVLAIVKAGSVEFAGKGVEGLVEESIEKGLTAEAALASMRKKCLDDINAKAPKAPGADQDIELGKQSHIERAKAYAAEHKCSMTAALLATAEKKKKQ